MYSLVIYLVLMILETEAVDFAYENPVIRLRVGYDTNESYTVLKDKPLKIVIENANARYVWCATIYKQNKFKRFVNETEFNTDIYAVLNITNVTTEMSTRWGCTVLQEYTSGPKYRHKNSYYTAKNLYFHLHVKGAGSVNVTVNDRIVSYVTPNLSVNYDGDATYDYEDDEEINFSCSKTKNSGDTDTQLEYYDAEGNFLLETKHSTQQIKFRSVLKPEHNNYYLVCICFTKNPDRTYKYRITFFMKKREFYADSAEHAMILSVNGHKLTTSGIKQPSHTDQYVFRYIAGEILNVTCQINHYVKSGTLNFLSNADEEDILGSALRSPEMKVISLKLFTSNLNNKTVTCGINNTDIRKPVAKILFKSEVRDNEVRVRGLNRRNVLYQYSNSIHQWNIEYRYLVNDTLNLTCVFKNGFSMAPRSSMSIEENTKPFLWKFQGKEIISPGNTFFITRFLFSNNFTITLDATHDRKIIQCIYSNPINKFKHSVKIILRLKPVSEVESDEVTSDVKDSSVPRIVSLVFAGVTVVIVTIVCLAYYRKRSKQSRLIQNAYDNLSNENDSPIPAFPHQWDIDHDDSHYSKIDEGVPQENSNYATVNDIFNRMSLNRHSNTSENPYSEIDEYTKPKSDKSVTNWNNAVYAQPSNSKRKVSPINKAIDNNISDSNQGTYDKLRHINPFNKDLNPINANYSNVQRMGNKNKSVTFGPNYKQDSERAFKQNHSNYENTQPVYMKPENVKKQPCYEKNHVKNESTAKTDSDYAEPYSELEVSCKNDLYVASNH